MRASRVAAAMMLVAAIALSTNVATIQTFPSWFDEAFFADTAVHLASGRGLRMELIPGYWPGPVHLYGPVFFSLQALGIHAFGLDALVFRLPNLVAGYGAVLLMALQLHRAGLGRGWQFAYALATILDVSFNRNIVSGRMDMLALFLVATAWVTATYPVNRLWLRGAATGLVSALAFLCTPRALFILPMVVLAAISHAWFPAERRSERHWRAVVLAAVAFAVPVAVWIEHVGGISVYAAQFTSNAIASAHIASSFFRSAYDDVAIALMLALAALNMRTIARDPILAGMAASYVAFSLFVKEEGPYAGMLMPIVLALVIAMLARSVTSPLLRGAVLAAVLVPGAGVLVLRGADLVLNADCRDGARVQRALLAFSSPRAQVVAPFKYFFLLQPAAGQLRTYEYAGSQVAEVIAAAQVVVAEAGMGAVLRQQGFTEVAALECTTQRLPLLPASFYRRSIFDETIYRKVP